MKIKYILVLISTMIIVTSCKDHVGTPLTQKELKKEYDSTFPYEAHLKKIEDKHLYVEFINYSDEDLTWWRINYNLIDENDEIIKESTMNYSSYPKFLSATSKTTEKLFFEVPDNTIKANIELVEVKTK